jgi:hypothetical protein
VESTDRTPQAGGAVEILTAQIFYLNFFFDIILSRPQLLWKMRPSIEKLQVHVRCIHMRVSATL